jgi:RNA recognition motif-containing protein
MGETSWSDAQLGNLPTEKVSKRDLFYIFHKYGRLAQVSIKQAYGFVQFLDADACRRALQAEQGQTVRGRKMRKSSAS